MQQLPQSPDPGESTSHSQRFSSSTLLTEAVVNSWLAKSLAVDMASHGDDSSVDENDNVSSMGESAWDIIDEGSAASDDDGQPLQHPTFSSDGLEHLQIDRGSLEPDEASDKSHGSQRALSNIGHEGFDELRHDTSSEMEETSSSAPASRAARPNNDVGPHSGQSYKRQARAQPLKFPEPKRPREEVGTADVSDTLMSFEGEQYKQLCAEYQIQSGPIVGRVRQRMSGQKLQLSGPYKVLYVGPTHMKRPILEKIGSALASSTGKTLAESEIDSSRVTVVPISSFGDESSEDRDVMLVDSLGLDMSIEECTSAFYVKEEAWKDTVSLMLNGHKVVQSSWNPASNAYQVSKDYILPDLAIVYLPENESTSAKQTRLLARNFVSRHEIPTIVIAAETSWKKPAQALFLDHRTPHFSIEASDAPRVLCRLPIDLPTFLEIDAGQLNRNLACLPPRPSPQSLNDEQGKNPKGGVAASGFAWRRRSPAISGLVGALVILYLVFLKLSYLSTEEVLTGMSGTSQPSVQAATPTEMPPAKPHSATSAWLETSTPTPTNLSDLQAKANLTTILHDSALMPNKSEKFKVHVIGDCHVILSPPAWFAILKKAPPLHFRVARDDKVLEYEFSTLFDGVYALKLPQEDAHGTVSISVWSTKKPKVNESFQVDFGTPWLKVAGWQRAAHGLTEQVRDELQSAQTGLARAYEQTSQGLQAFMRDAVRSADYVLKEVEKAGMSSLTHTTRTTENVVAQSMELSRAVSEQLQFSNIKSASLGWAHRQNIRGDISIYARKMSDMFTQQAKVFTEAATGLDVVALANEIQEYREKNLIQTQKKALHMWWKVRGAPAAAKNHAECKRSKPHRKRPKHARKE